MCHQLQDLRAHPWPTRQRKQECTYTWCVRQGQAAAWECTVEVGPAGCSGDGRGSQEEEEGGAGTHSMVWRSECIQCYAYIRLDGGPTSMWRHRVLPCITCLAN